MKFNCGLTPEEKAAIRYEKQKAHRAYQQGWHEAFAFLPVRVAPRLCVWLGVYERRLVTVYDPSRADYDSRYYDKWEYREYVPTLPPVPL